MAQRADRLGASHLGGRHARRGERHATVALVAGRRRSCCAGRRRARRRPARRARRAAKSVTCSACHGQAGNSRSSAMPIIAGMDAAYIKKQIAGLRRRASGPRPRWSPTPSRCWTWAWTTSRPTSPRRRREPTPIQSTRGGGGARARAAAAQCAACHGAARQGRRGQAASRAWPARRRAICASRCVLFKQDRRNPGDADADRGQGADEDHSRRDRSRIWPRTTRASGKNRRGPLLKF